MAWASPGDPGQGLGSAEQQTPPEYKGRGALSAPPLGDLFGSDAGPDPPQDRPADIDAEGPEPAAGLGQDLNAFTLGKAPQPLPLLRGGVCGCQEHKLQNKAPGLKAWRCRSLAICVILGQGPALSKPQFLLLHKGALGQFLPQEWNETTCGKHRHGALPDTIIRRNLFGAPGVVHAPP